MKFCRLVALLLPLAATATQFSLNNDMSCDSPFKSLKISNVLCSSHSYFTLTDEGGNDNSNSQSLCSFGGRMEMTGEFTLAEPMFSALNIKIQLCSDPDEDNSQWWRRSNCKTVSTSLELLPDQYGESSWLEAGSHSFASRFKVPAVGTGFSQGSSVSVTMTFHPRKSYYSTSNGDGTYDGYFVSKEWTCSTSLDTVQSSQGYRAYYAVIAGGIGSLLASLFIARKRRIICVERSRKSRDQEAEIEATNFHSMT